MWIYDGEQWIEEGGSESDAKPDTTMPQFDQFYPELQVIEIPLPRPTYVPSFPLPYPLP
jgi:hypothetical protein